MADVSSTLIAEFSKMSLVKRLRVFRIYMSKAFGVFFHPGASGLDLSDNIVGAFIRKNSPESYTSVLSTSAKDSIDI